MTNCYRCGDQLAGGTYCGAACEGLNRDFFLKQLGKLWMKNEAPLRFGQLVTLVHHLADSGADIFNLPDEEWHRGLLHLSQRDA